MYKKIGLIGLILTMFLVSCANNASSDAQTTDVQNQTENLQQQVGQTQQQNIPAGQAIPQQDIPQGQAIPQQAVPMQQAIPQSINPLEGGPSAINQSANITLDQAKQIAVADAGIETTSAAFTKMSSDYDNGFMQWEIDFVSGNMKYEYEISSIDGTILKKEMEVVTQASFPQESNPFQQGLAVDPTGHTGIKVDLNKAREIAVQHSGVDAANVIFTKQEYDIEHATPRWEIEFVIGNLQYEYEISAVNGAVLKFKSKNFTID